jgi:hypothetical protein
VKELGLLIKVYYRLKQRKGEHNARNEKTKNDGWWNDEKTHDEKRWYG